MERRQTDAGVLLRGSAFPSGPLNLPQSLDVQPTIAPPTFRPWDPSSGGEDIVLLAEFSEIEGPVPLLSIPQSPSSSLDLNEFVVKVLSTDYLNTSGEFHVYEDTQLVQEDLNPGVHVYVHYFTLFDVRARGFVRPMCLSYISTDHSKLLHYFSHLKQKFTLATEYLKISNFTWFSEEMEGLIRDLEYTKHRYIQAQRTNHESTRRGSYGKEEEIGEGEVVAGGRGSAPSSHPDQEVQDTHDNRHRLSSVIMTVPLSCASHASLNLPNPSQLFPQDDSLLNTSDSDIGQKRLEKKQDEKQQLGEEKEEEEQDLSPIIIQSTKEERESDGGVEEGEESMLKHTSLESVAMQIMECQHILDIIKPIVEKKDIEEDLNSLSDHILSHPHSPLYKAMRDLDMLKKPEAKFQPTICILSLMKRSFHDMRTIQQLCGMGYVGCLFQLRTIYERFCKPFRTLMFEDLDSELYRNPYGSLFIGNVPTVLVIKDKNSKPSVQMSPYSGLCWDTQFVKFIRNGTSHVSTPDSEYVPASDNSLDTAFVSAAADCLEVFSRSRERYTSSTEKSVNSQSSYDEQQSHKTQEETKKEPEDVSQSFRLEEKSSEQNAQEGKDTKDGRSVLVTQGSFNSLSSWTSNLDASPLDLAGYEDIHEEEGVEEDICTLAKGEAVPHVDIDNRRIISKVCRLAGLVQQFCGVSHCLVHSLLSGRPVIIAAEESYRPTVVMYVRALSTLLPRTPTVPLPVLRWHSGVVTEHHLQQYRLMGVCIPERLHVQDLMSNTVLNQVTVLNIETGHISGVAYSGSLVRGVEHYGRKLFHSNSALQTCLQSIIVALGLKVFLLYHLMGVTNRTTPEILKGLGVSKGDWDIIMYLTEMVQKQRNRRMQALS